MKRDMNMMLTTSTKFCGIRIESGSGLFTLVMNILFTMHMLYDDFSYGFYVYELLKISLLVDEGMVTLSTMTLIWSKGLI